MRLFSIFLILIFSAFAEWDHIGYLNNFQELPAQNLEVFYCGPSAFRFSTSRPEDMSGNGRHGTNRNTAPTITSTGFTFSGGGDFYVSNMAATTLDSTDLTIISHFDPSNAYHYVHSSGTNYSPRMWTWANGDVYQDVYSDELVQNPSHGNDWVVAALRYNETSKLQKNTVWNISGTKSEVSQTIASSITQQDVMSIGSFGGGTARFSGVIGSIVVITADLTDSELQLYRLRLKRLSIVQGGDTVWSGRFGY